MAFTLLDASRLSNDTLYKGVIETIVSESDVLQRLPFVEVLGNGLTYNRELAMATVQWRGVGGTWTESTPTTTPLTAVLCILGGDAEVDKFLLRTRSNVIDLKAEVTEKKAKACRYEIERAFVYGNHATNPLEPDGLTTLINTGLASAQVVAAGAAGAALTLPMLDQLIDAVVGGKPDLLLMSKRSRRRITNLARTFAGSNQLETSRDAFGKPYMMYNGIPIGISDWILDTHALAGSVETSFTAGACSTIYALRFGTDAIHGIAATSGKAEKVIETEDLGNVAQKDAQGVRVKAYLSFVDKSPLARAALIGVQ